MINVEVSTTINRSTAEVFAFVANFENMPKWETDFQEVRLLKPQPSGVGTTYHCILKMPGQTAESRFEITEYEANRKIAYEGEAAGPAKPKGSYLFQSLGQGTQVTSLPRPEMRGFFKLLEPMMARYIRQRNEAHLKKLKSLLEA
ncbi:MAG: SRPBCC family protein [Chloroflexi bacterium]|nr:SRPBCC family protein [Chloroflexota bacterium]MCI0579890.1 SRPBCC family protein [Chloroflexota bacterium]MCI0646171.1 SRPBCC family protein [Chloroflexota bacterium]MCI0729881.1 SRPBCC family protein [Chloroflexota bacterium]